MRLYLMRHGATAGNELRRYVGRASDEPLSETGVTQCARAGSFAQVELVYASPQQRAVQTARLCFPEARVVEVAGLEEYDFGDFEGRSASDMVDDAAYRAWVDGGCVARCPGGESREEYVRRTNAALADLLKQASQRGEERVFVVAHGGTIMAALSELCDEVPSGGDRYFGWHVGCCEGYEANVHLVGGAIRLSRPTRFTRLAL
jgi:alpha-ribazole phosphatase